jgi:pimeloyl-ACP methyl ester carboxylesterase
MKKRTAVAGASVAVLAVGVLTFHPSRPLYMRHRSLEVMAPDGVVLSATLSWPRWSRGPVPGFVMVHGSGRLAREHLRGDTRRLVRRGFGVLAYDKRGVGRSGGEYPSSLAGDADSTLRLLAGDAAAAFRRMVEEPGIDASRSGFFGGSQAGWIIPLAAEMLEPKPSFHVILSGPAVSTGVEQFYSDMTGDGNRPPAVADPKEIEARLERFDGEPGYDPLPALAATEVPTLWLLGDRDQSVPTLASARVLASLSSNGTGRHVVIRYPEAGHDLRDVHSGDPVPIWDDMRSWLRDLGMITD